MKKTVLLIFIFVIFILRICYNSYERSKHKYTIIYKNNGFEFTVRCKRYNNKTRQGHFCSHDYSGTQAYMYIPDSIISVVEE